jgi:hypothetical protein
MIITSYQQIEKLINPSNSLDLNEFEEITLQFGSFLCICYNKKLNFLNLLKLIIEDKKIQKLYCDLLGEYNLQYVIKTYIDNIPGFYKKIFRSKFNK